MAMRGFTFDGIQSLDYGIGITGESVYNAPERDVNVIEVPGRNGNYILDNGRFNNIEAVYQAGMADTEQSDFAARVSDFRNELLSRIGYKRLEDDYHPDEYRMAYCTGGFNLSASHNSTAGEFDVKFNCKPQRFLKSGEVPISVTSGDTITNPTMFPSCPLLEVEGYGEITINDDVITIQDAPLGWIPLTSQTTVTSNSMIGFFTVYFDATDLYYAGDEIAVGRIAWSFSFTIAGARASSIQMTDSSGDLQVGISRGTGIIDIMTRNYSNLTFTAGQYSIVNYQPYAEFTYEDENQITQTIRVNLSLYAEYNDDRIVMSPVSHSTLGTGSIVPDRGWKELYNARVNSTYSALGNPLYLDLETGQAYKYENSEYVSVNNVVWLGAELPVLKAGANTITYGQDVHDLKVVPRWWII